MYFFKNNSTSAKSLKIYDFKLRNNHLLGHISPRFRRYSILKKTCFYSLWYLSADAMFDIWIFPEVHERKLNTEHHINFNSKIISVWVISRRDLGDIQFWIRGFESYCGIYLIRLCSIYGFFSNKLTQIQILIENDVFFWKRVSLKNKEHFKRLHCNFWFWDVAMIIL